MLPDTIYGASEKYFSTFTTPSDCPLLLLLSPDDPNPPHKKKKDEPYRDRVNRGYCSRKHDEKLCYKIRVSIAPRALIKTINFITIIVFRDWFRDD